MAGAKLDISEARAQFSSLDKRLKDEHVIQILRHNKPAFAVIDIDYLESVLETLEILSDPDAMRQLEASLEDIREGRVVSIDEAMDELL